MSTDKTLADALTRFRCAGYDPTDGSGPIMVADPEGPWVLAADVIGTGSDCEATPASPDAPESGGDWFGDVLGSIGTVIPLADVQPGGRVRLGDQAERARFEAWNRENWPNLDLSRGPLGDYMQARVRSDWQLWQAAQPSPGGQGDDSPMAKMAAALRGKAEAERAAFDQRVLSGEWGPMPDNPDVLELPPLPEEVDSVRCMIRGEKGFAEPCDYYFTSKQMRDYARTALAASQPVEEPIAEVVVVDGVRKLRVYPDEGLRSLLQFPVGTKFYTAPPAQAVDLERFRGTVKSQHSMTEWMHRCGFVSAEKLEESKKNHDHLMALIDSQAVGNK